MKAQYKVRFGMTIALGAILFPLGAECALAGLNEELGREIEYCLPVVNDVGKNESNKSATALL